MRREGKVELDVKVSVRNKHVFYRVKTGLSAGNQLVSDFLIFSLQSIRLRLRDITIEAENSLIAASCVSYYVSQCVPMCPNVSQCVSVSGRVSVLPPERILRAEAESALVVRLHQSRSRC